MRILFNGGNYKKGPPCYNIGTYCEFHIDHSLEGAHHNPKEIICSDTSIVKIYKYSCGKNIHKVMVYQGYDVTRMFKSFAKNF